MVGTAPDTQGGVSAVVGVLMDGGLFARCNIKYIASHRDGGFFTKFVTALRGWMSYMSHQCSGRISLLHVHMASRASFWRKLLFILPAFAARIPVIIHLHGGEFHLFHDKESSFIVRRLIRFVFERANRVIVLSDGWRQWVMKTFPRSRVVTIYNPVMLMLSPLSPREAMSLLFLGRVGEKKGAFDLISAVARLKQHYPSIKLYMGGDGDIEGTKRHAMGLGVSETLELLGWVGGAAKENLLEKTSIYVLPSYNEGLPMSILEAMAHGLPVVATSVGGIPEAVSDGVEGFLVPPGDVAALEDRLQRLLSNKALRRQMGEAARRKVERLFSAEVVVPQLEALYSELIGRGTC